MDVETVSADYARLTGIPLSDSGSDNESGHSSRQRPARESSRQKDDQVEQDLTDGSYDDSACSSASSAESDRTTEQPTCPICLEPIRDRAVLDKCFHEFCFVCVKTWSEVSPTCPLCKSSFDAIVHHIRSESQFELYRPPKPQQQGAQLQRESQPRYVYGRTDMTRFAASVEWRRRVYLRNAHVLPEADPALRRRLQSLEPSQLRRPANLRRIRPWLERELQAVVGPENRDFLLTYVMSLLHNVDLRDMGHMATLLRPYLFGRTEHFLHELGHFCRSCLDMSAYDHHARYDRTVEHQPLPPRRRRRGQVREREHAAEEPTEDHRNITRPRRTATPSSERSSSRSSSARRDMHRPRRYGDGTRQGALGVLAARRRQDESRSEAISPSASDEGDGAVSKNGDDQLQALALARVAMDARVKRRCMSAGGNSVRAIDAATSARSDLDGTSSTPKSSERKDSQQAQTFSNSSASATAGQIDAASTPISDTPPVNSDKDALRHLKQQVAAMEQRVRDKRKRLLQLKLARELQAATDFDM